jgi:CP family cyanate transporter-like MFS transporter
VLIGLNLRIPVASVPPVIDEISDDLDLSSAAAGLLTSAPILCFGLLAPVAPAFARRLGGERVLLVALVPILVGVLIRAAPSVATLFAGTLLAGAGVAVANVIVPSVIKGRYEGQEGVLTGVYVAILGVGAAFAAGLTVPIAQALDAGWEAGLAIWAIPAAVATAVVATAVLPEHGAPTAGGGPGDARVLLRDGLAWQVTIYMGLQSLLFYVGLAWLPSILRDDGYSATGAAAYLALYVLGGIPPSLVVPVIATRIRDQRLLAVGIAALEAAALAGLLAAPGGALIWVSFLAIAQGGAFSLALTFFVLRAPDQERAAELSAMAQAIGYTLAAVGPFAFGALHDTTDGWDLPLAALLATTVPLLAAGVAAGRPRTVRPRAPLVQISSRCRGARRRRRGSALPRS